MRASGWFIDARVPERARTAKRCDDGVVGTIPEEQTASDATTAAGNVERDTSARDAVHRDRTRKDDVLENDAKRG